MRGILRFGGALVCAVIVGCGGGGGGNASPAPTSTSAAVTVTVSPSSPTVTIGGSQQFTASISSGTSPNWIWTVTPPSGWTGEAGTISTTGMYQTPYPAPVTVTITATSSSDPSVSGKTTVSLTPPATAAGPYLTVDAGNHLHAISPLIYGANGWQLDAASAATANFSIVRWGGDATSRYNYKLNTTNSAADWYFENFNGMNGGYPNPNTVASFTDFMSAADAAGMQVMGTVPLQGWVSNSNTNNNAGSAPACSFPQSTYPGQAKYDGSCGNGICPSGSSCGTQMTCTTSGGCSLLGDSNVVKVSSVEVLAPACSMSCSAAMPYGMSASQTGCVQTCTEAKMPTAAQATTAWAQGTWSGGWAHSIATNSAYGNGASGKGVAIWDLDNEPAWWDAVHRDVHPAPSTYDEVTWGGISTALAIKAADASAQVSGPVIDYWWNYFYSKQDIENGWGHGSPCYQPWSNPADRTAHGGVPMIEYYLQQFRAAEATYGTRLLDYLVIHAYFAGTYNGKSVAFTTAGDTAEQVARLNSTRVLWDPTYTDSSLPQPNYFTDSNYTSNCNVPAQPPQVVPMLQSWVAKNYPGTKTAIDEYNFGGLESINGAVTQADVLGIFGQYGLDLATLWPTDQYSKQGPANEAFAIYRNYDGAKASFGDVALASCSTTAALTAACVPTAAAAADETGQGQVSVYGALRSSDNALTIVVINKTFGALTSGLSLANVGGIATSADVYQYSSANPAQIVKQASVSVTPPVSAGKPATVSYTFPTQSISLFVIPQ
ncbi:MAG TPA: glycoside hydrolase family 44 protein [Acidobacteriaceae bacterium]|nr:glycoside hydrolase family 44 protein [Acidobacteriaceae bacterium]